MRRIAARVSGAGSEQGEPGSRRPGLNGSAVTLHVLDDENGSCLVLRKNDADYSLWTRVNAVPGRPELNLAFRSRTKNLKLSA